jgi:hypothetical protein
MFWVSPVTWPEEEKHQDYRFIDIFPATGKKMKFNKLE